MERERTTKTVTMTITAEFYGDYIGADEVTACLQGWVERGLEDRDDLRTWEFGEAVVTEVDGNPHGWCA